MLYFAILCVIVKSDPYAQIGGRPAGTHEHWEGIPRGSSLRSGCWLCRYGCAVLSTLKLKGLYPSKENVERYLDSNADMVWSWAGLRYSDEIVAPSVGKVSGRSHYVYIQRESGGSFTIYDPDGGRYRTGVSESYFDYCYY